MTAAFFISPSKAVLADKPSSYSQLRDKPSFTWQSG